MSKIKAGSIVMFKPTADAQRATTARYGWNSQMTRIVNESQDARIRVNCRSSGDNRVRFDGDGGYSWAVESFVDVTGKTVNGLQVGDSVVRTERFTPSFVVGEVHRIESVSADGKYIKVHGHRHYVPERYFELSAKLEVPTPVPSPAAPELTDFDAPTSTSDAEGRVPGDNPSGCGLVAKTEPVESPAARSERTGYHKFKVGDAVKHDPKSTRVLVVGLISGCGYKFQAKTPYVHLGWLEMKDFIHECESELVNRDSVAGLILQGVAVQYRNLGEWFDVSPNTLTVAMIGRMDFRVKPMTADYYGNTIPASVDLNKTKVKTVWGISLNNNKIYPCALGTARVNKSKGHRLYWETESQAQQVLDVLMKPFKEAN